MEDYYKMEKTTKHENRALRKHNFDSKSVP